MCGAGDHHGLPIGAAGDRQNARHGEQPDRRGGPGDEAEIADDGRQLSGDNVIIATGARQRAIQSLPIDHEVVITGREALERRKVPDRVVVVGGGAAGCEFLFEDFEFFVGFGHGGAIHNSDRRARQRSKTHAPRTCDLRSRSRRPWHACAVSKRLRSTAQHPIAACLAAT